MILQKGLSVYSSRRAKSLSLVLLLLLSLLLLPVASTSGLFGYTFAPSPMCFQKRISSQTYLILLNPQSGSSHPHSRTNFPLRVQRSWGLEGTGLPLPEKHPGLQFPRKLLAGPGNLHSGSFYPLKNSMCLISRKTSAGNQTICSNHGGKSTHSDAHWASYRLK